MADALRELAAIEGLLPKDVILARALIRNGFVEPGNVIEAARALAECGPDQYGGGILDRLTASGHLDEERAAKIEKALVRKIAARRAEGGPEARAPSEPGGDSPAESVEPEKAEAEQPEPPGAPDEGDKEAMKSARLWKPRRRRREEPGAGESSVVLFEELGARRLEKEREAMESLIDRFISSPLHQAVLERLSRRGMGVADPRSLARELDVPEKRIRRVLKDWQGRGLLKRLGEYPFYYEPGPRLKADINRFLQAWKDPAQRSQLLARIVRLEAE
jgi:hypothetical protein